MQSIFSRTNRRRVRPCWMGGSILILSLFNSAISQAQQTSPVHPLDPLSKEEIARTADLLRKSGKVKEDGRFSIIVLHEPPKAELLAFAPGQEMRREAFAVIYERSSNKTYEAVVDLKNSSLRSWNEVPGMQASRLLEEMMIKPEVVKSNPQWQAAMLRRGITDFENVQVDPWGAGYIGFPDEEGMRVARAVSYYKGGSKNYYAHPIEGVIAYIDLNKMKVFKVIDTEVVVPAPRGNAEIDARSIGRQRRAPQPLSISQPRGASFAIQRNEVSWQGWRFRFGMHPREGLVLYTVGYEDQGKLRSILYRAGLSEMVVPYGDPDAAWFFRNAFDEGEDGIGRFANSLEPLTDCPNNATFFNAVFPDDDGAPTETPRAIALYERDGGLLWKHSFEEGNESRRSRELVLAWIATVGNYEYGFNWVFHQDGSLEMEVLLTGIMQVKGIQPVSETNMAHASGSHGHLVAKDLVAVHHQHFFNFRLDLDVDGANGNSVVEQNTESLPPGPENPYGGAFIMKESLFHREEDGRRLLNLASSRKWKVINPSSKNPLGQSTGYMLIPGENSVPYASPDSSVRRRAGFINAHLWVTPYDSKQTNAAGYYINFNKGGDGLPKWTGENRPIENQDVVLWYTMGITHIPRPEEWPVMTVHRAGFKLVPAGFFVGNPSLDVPRSENLAEGGK
jgi:primary-amine oxidase